MMDTGISARNDEGTFLVFGYASNMLKVRFHLHTPTAELIGAAKLEGHRLTFRTPTGWLLEESLFRGATASIQEDPNEHVWGSLWRLHSCDFPNLYPPASKCKNVTVTTQDGKDHQCLAYVIPTPFEEHLPSPHYLKVVVDGAIESGLPASYVDFLKGIQHNGDTTPPPIMKEIY